jgi:DNA-binding LytR/AlgR family response regulator
MVESYLERVEGVEFCLKAGDGLTALQLLSSGQIDAAFIDLQMPELDGVSVLKALPRDLPIVVISASDEFGARSYEFNVADYLVKPLEFPRFHQAVMKLKERIAATQRSDAVTAGRGETAHEIFVKDGTRILKIELDELLFLKAESNYVEFVSEGGSVLSLVSLKKLEELLPPEFIRIHRSYMVNKNRIAKIEEGCVHVGKHRLPISQGYRDELIRRLHVIN